MIEKGVGFKNSFKDFKRDINPQNISTGLVAGIFGLSAGVVMISAGSAAGMGSDLIILWVTSMFVLCGVFGILVPTYYRLPIPMASSLPGALLFAASVPSVGLGPTLGATLIAGVLTFLVGISGFLGKVIDFIPMPIVMGMIGGVLFSFGIDMVTPLENAFWPSVLMIGTFFIVNKFIPKFPAVLATLIIGIVYLLLSDINFSGIEFSVAYPEIVLPTFTLDGFFAYGLPLFIILIGMETPAGVGLMKSEGVKEVPTNGITAIDGFGTMIGSFIGTHSIAIAAPMTGITNSPEAGKLEARWVSAVIIGVIFLAAAPFYGFLVTLFEITPTFFLAIIAGLALMRVIITTIGGALGADKFKLGALFAFLIAASEITILGIGSSFWALVFGIVISLFAETKDFIQHKKEESQSNIQDETNQSIG